jgi:hypothetical protein
MQIGSTILIECVLVLLTGLLVRSCVDLSKCTVLLGLVLHTKMDQIECSETSTYNIQTLKNRPKKDYNIQNTAKV